MTRDILEKVVFFSLESVFIYVLDHFSFLLCAQGRPQVFGHAGLGGSFGFADRDNQLGFGYVRGMLEGGFLEFMIIFKIS
jgi:hypothetical protein